MTVAYILAWGLVVIFLGQTSCRKLVDLTHTLDEHAPKWPRNELKNKTYYKKIDISWKRHEKFWTAVSYMEYYEHFGTHIDAPIHTAEGRQTLEQIPVDKLMGPGVVFNIKDKVKENPDYGLTVSDIEEYEAEFGRIPDGAIVVINSGWQVKYPRPELVFGSKTFGDAATYHYPGYLMEAAEFLFIKRNVRVLGIDTPSIDLGIDTDYPVHMYLQAFDVPLLEYVANLDSIPQNGITIFLGAPKFRGGTGGPTRVIAVVDDDSDRSLNHGAYLTPFILSNVIAVLAFVLFTMTK